MHATPDDGMPGVQVVRSRLQQQQAAGRAVYYKDSWTTLRLILRREGPGGLYKGFAPSVLKVMPASAITLLVYEKLMQQMMRLDQAHDPEWLQH